jgi:hypothetical protein
MFRFLCNAELHTIFRDLLHTLSRTEPQELMRCASTVVEFVSVIHALLPSLFPEFNYNSKVDIV